MNVSDIMVNREEESKMITQDSAEYVKNNLEMFMVNKSFRLFHGFIPRIFYERWSKRRDI